MDEYLWTKTGSDPEIEQLEAALKCVAYRPSTPPELPAKHLAFVAPRRSLFRLSFGFAAGFLALVGLGSTWVLLRNEPPAAQQAAVNSVPEMPVTAIRTAPPPTAVIASPKVSRRDKPQRRPAAPRPVETNAIRPQTLVLTKAEADAYRQLMTALSITSTNLKIVKDKVNGTE